MQYETVAEAYRDLEQASGRLALVERLAALLSETPAELLPVVCYLCQGLIAPEFAGVDLGLAEKLAVRAVATATGAEPGGGRRPHPGDRRPGAGRGAVADGDRGRPAGQPDRHRRGGHPAPDRRGAGPGVAGPQAGPAGLLLARATPLEARYLLRLVTKGLRLGIGTPTILDALAQVLHRRPDGPAGARARLQHLLRPGPGGRRAGRRGGWRRPSRSGCARATRCGPCWPSGCPTPGRSWPSWAGSARRSTSTTASGCRRTAPRTARSSCTPAGWSASAASSPTWWRCWRPGSGPARRSWRARSWRTTRPPGSCTRSARSCSGGASTASPKPCSTCRWGCSASSCCTPTGRT